MLICGSGSGIRDPLKTNSRGKLLVFKVVVAIFISPRMMWKRDWVGSDLGLYQPKVVRGTLLRMPALHCDCSLLRDDVNVNKGRILEKALNLPVI